MKKKAVIFDFNGTLFFDSDKHIEAWNVYIEKIWGRRLTNEELVNIFGRTNKGIFEYLFKREPNGDEAEVIGAEKERVYRELCEKDAGCCVLAPGAAELLDELKNEGVLMAIATSSEITNVDFYFDKFDIERWFNRETVIYSDGSFEGKPAPDIYLKAAERLGVKPQECIVFEDALSGVRSAKNAEIGKVVGVLSSDNERELRDENLWRIIKDYSEINSIDELLE